MTDITDIKNNLETSSENEVKSDEAHIHEELEEVPENWLKAFFFEKNDVIMFKNIYKLSKCTLVKISNKVGLKEKSFIIAFANKIDAVSDPLITKATTHLDGFANKACNYVMPYMPSKETIQKYSDKIKNPIEDKYKFLYAKINGFNVYICENYAATKEKASSIVKPKIDLIKDFKVAVYVTFVYDFLRENVFIKAQTIIIDKKIWAAKKIKQIKIPFLSLKNQEEVENKEKINDSQDEKAESAKEQIEKKIKSIVGECYQVCNEKYQNYKTYVHEKIDFSVNKVKEGINKGLEVKDSIISKTNDIKTKFLKIVTFTN